MSRWGRRSSSEQSMARVTVTSQHQSPHVVTTLCRAGDSYQCVGNESDTADAMFEFLIKIINIGH